MIRFFFDAILTPVKKNNFSEMEGNQMQYSMILQ